MRPPPLDDAREWRTGSRQRRRPPRCAAPGASPRTTRAALLGCRDAPDVDARGASPATCLEHAGPRAAATHGRVVADMSRAAGRTEIIARVGGCSEARSRNSLALRAKFCPETCNRATNSQTGAV